MSFSSDVKEELESVFPNARHCMLSELASINRYISGRADSESSASRKLFSLQKKTNMLEKYVDADFKRSCCIRAYLRGAFLCTGSVNDPGKSYNLEFVLSDSKEAERISELLKTFDIDSRINKRKNTFVVYIREAEGIVDMLNIMGAHRSLMYVESLRVVKDVRNNLNRKVNCEAANIVKSVNASARQIEDIKKIDRVLGLKKLEEPLREMAYVRLEHESATLAELGGYLNPPVGKSGVNHRLRKLSEIADRL
ncbi:MAG: DNA-binding protein WhiA [Lachnospiraceae bacterium]|nr:DNA-binding protein WhiA [Lachnospiraceae bacterium]